MTKITLMIFIALTLAFNTGCELNVEGGGGTYTGPDKSPNGDILDPDSGEDEPTISDPLALKLFEPENHGTNADWIDTGLDNDLQMASFMSYQMGTFKTAFSFDEELAANIHSHYISDESKSWKNYTFTGSMLIDDPRGSIGITFYSNYPNSDTYYRIRRYSRSDDKTNGDPFQFSAHPDLGLGKNDPRCQSFLQDRGKYKSDVVPEANVWYHFEVSVKSEPDYNVVKAKIWSELEDRPSDYQIICYDYTASRISSGTAGIWMGVTREGVSNALEDYGEKYFKDFTVHFDK